MKKQGKDILEDLFPNCGDQKKPVAIASGDAIKSWIRTCGLDSIVKYVHFGLDVPKARPVLMAVFNEVLTELDAANKLSLEIIEPFVKPFIDCCLDKDAKIKGACKLFMPIVFKHYTAPKILGVIMNEYKADQQMTLKKSLKKLIGDA